MTIKITTECGETTCDACGCLSWDTGMGWRCELFGEVLGGISDPEPNAYRCMACVEKFGRGEK